jgi:hypothetical protein
MPLCTRQKQSCKNCTANTAPNLARSRCLADAGYYGNGVECPVDSYCYLGSKYTWCAFAAVTDSGADP